MLMTLDEFPNNVLAGFREDKAAFMEALHSLRASTPTAIGPGIARCLDYLNVSRTKNATDYFGFVCHI